MKRALVYSVSHTGTWFVINLLMSTSRDAIECGDAQVRRWGRGKDLIKHLETMSVNKNWFVNGVRKYIPEEERNHDLYILNCHHYNQYSPLLNHLRTGQLIEGTPIAVPVRDPLLSVNTVIWKRWRDYKRFVKDDKDQTRLDRIKIQVQLLKDMLMLPPNMVYLFPIDLYTDLEQRKTVGYGLLNFCGLQPSMKTHKYIANWKPENKTTQADIVVSKPHDHSQFIKIKNCYRRGDAKTVRELLPIEFDYLHSRDDLKALLRNIGYKDMLWW